MLLCAILIAVVYVCSCSWLPWKKSVFCCGSSWKGFRTTDAVVWVGNYGYYWENILSQNKKITLPKILVYCLAESESSTAYYSRSIHQPAKSLWEAYDHFSVCICVCVLIFEHVTIGSYFAQISSFSPFLAPNRHLPRVSWSASFVITGIYHVGRCLWTDGNRLRTNYLIPYKFQHWDILF